MTKPIQKFSVGGIKVAIWENEGKNGPYNTVTMGRCYKSEDGEWKTSNSFRQNDLPKAALALDKAFEFISLKTPTSDDSEPEFSTAEQL